ncbi:hypothetical protein Tco_1457322 [Tanacetum coccineum]
MNPNYYEPNLCYNSNSSGFDQFQPLQYSIIHQMSMEMLLAIEKLIKATRTYLNNNDQSSEEKNLQTLDENSIQLKQEEQAAKVSSQYWKPPILYDDNDDDDEESSIPLREIISELPLSVAITSDLPITNSIIMEGEHLNTIPETKSNEENEPSVKDLNLTSSESENLSEDLFDNESECDMPVGDDSSSKNKADPEEDIRLIEKLLNDDSFPHSLKELNSKIPDAIIESFSPSPIPVEDSDSLMEEIVIFLSKDDSIHPRDDDVYFDIEPDTGVLTTKVVDDISDNSTRELYVHVPNVLLTLPTLLSSV